MKISLEKASGRANCRHPECQSNPQYVEKGKIKRGTTCARIVISTGVGIYNFLYCRECLEKVHDQVRAILNPQLWVFM